MVLQVQVRQQTCQQILLNSGLPFLVIEPAKTEYRGLYELDNTIQFYTLGNEQISHFVLIHLNFCQMNSLQVILTL